MGSRCETRHRETRHGGGTKITKFTKITKNLMVFFVVCVIFVGFVPPPSAVSAQTSPSGTWPQFRGNPRLTGVASDVPPKRATSIAGMPLASAQLTRDFARDD